MFDPEIAAGMLPNIGALEVYAAINGVDFKHKLLYITYRKFERRVAIYILVRDPNSKTQENVMFNHETMKDYTAAGGLPYM